MTREEIFKKILKKKGIDSQVWGTIEEMSELTQALSKWRRFGIERARESIEEEMADVELMFEHMKMFFDIKPQTLTAYKAIKLQRVIEELNL